MRDVGKRHFTHSVVVMVVAIAIMVSACNVNAPGGTEPANRAQLQTPDSAKVIVVDDQIPPDLTNRTPSPHFKTGTAISSPDNGTPPSHPTTKPSACNPIRLLPITRAAPPTSTPATTPTPSATTPRQSNWNRITPLTGDAVPTLTTPDRLPSPKKPSPTLPKPSNLIQVTTWATVNALSL